MYSRSSKGGVARGVGEGGENRSRRSIRYRGGNGGGVRQRQGVKRRGCEEMEGAERN